MFKLVIVICLGLGTFAAADDILPQPSVSVKCCGRLRHGVMAIGGESTGTKITFKRMAWELQLLTPADRAFAEKHNKQSVVVIGSLRKVIGTEVKDRWIVEVKSIATCDAPKDEEVALLSIQGTLRMKESGLGEAAAMTIDADGQSWPVDFSLEPNLQAMATALLDQPVQLLGQLKQFPEEESRPPVIQVKTLRPAGKTPIQYPGELLFR